MSNNNNNKMSNKNMTFLWKKSLTPLCSFSISKCLPTILSSNPTSPRHHLSPTTSISSSSNDDPSSQTTHTSPSSSLFITTDEYQPSDDYDDQPISEADFAAVFASQRFFFASPGSSNSIVETGKRHVVRRRRRRTVSFHDRYDDVEEVRKYSVDPRLDFRRSMQEMLEARKLNNNDNNNGISDERSDLEYLHELLLCFLSLNPNDTHKFVISAFTDVVVDLLSSSSKHNHDDDVRTCHGVKIQRRRDALRRLSM